MVAAHRMGRDSERRSDFFRRRFDVRSALFLSGGGRGALPELGVLQV